MNLHLPILQNEILSGEDARAQGIIWARRAALRSPEEAQKTLHPTEMEIPDQWIIESVEESLNAHIHSITHSAVKRIKVRTVLKEPEQHIQSKLENNNENPHG